MPGTSRPCWPSLSPIGAYVYAQAVQSGTSWGESARHGASRSSCACSSQLGGENLAGRQSGVFQGFVHAQAVPLGSASAASAGDGAHCPSAYEWSEQLSDGTLLAVGGGAPSTVHLWNLQQEICMEQVWLQKAGLVTISTDAWLKETTLCLLEAPDRGMMVLGRCMSSQVGSLRSRDNLAHTLHQIGVATYHLEAVGDSSEVTHRASRACCSANMVDLAPLLRLASPSPVSRTVTKPSQPETSSLAPLLSVSCTSCQECSARRPSHLALQEPGIISPCLCADTDRGQGPRGAAADGGEAHRSLAPPPAHGGRHHGRLRAALRPARAAQRRRAAQAALLAHGAAPDPQVSSRVSEATSVSP